MFQARIKDSRRKVFAVQIDDEPAWYTGKHPLICHKCDAGVHGKGTYVKRNGSSYRAHFALNPHANHEETCPLHPVAFITSLAQGAQDLAHADDGVLKLTLPSDVKDLAPQPEQAIEDLPLPVTAQQIDTVSPPLPPLLNCAAKIARFLQMHAFDDQVVKCFKVQPHGFKSTIPWGRFCYGPTASAYGELVSRLDPGSTKRAPSHPVAVYGTVQRVHHDRKGRPFVYLADHADLDGKEFEVVLRSSHPTLIEPLTVGTHVLAIGAWDMFSGGRVPQLRLFADEAWQIAYWHTDPDTGEATQPASPPAVTAHQRATERPAHGASRQIPARGPSPRPSRPTRGGRRRGMPPTRRLTASPATPPRPAPPSASARPPVSAAPDTPQHSPQPPAAPPADTPGAPPATPEAPCPQPSAEQPAVPPRPSRPPLPTSPPHRRKGLAEWLGLGKKRRRR